MEVSSASRQSWVPYPGQRAATTKYRSIFKGRQRALDNFELSLIRIGEEGSYSPRHRHNFEQFRLPLTMEFNQSPNRDIPKGHLGYIPEGVAYGPQDLKPGLEFLILQCGGPSRSGYMSHEELMEGTAALKQVGEFSDGVFRRVKKGGQSVRLNQDAYEAVWEYVNGKRIEYPEPRFLEPVTIDPAAFTPRPVPQMPGVQQRHLGTFNEYGTAAWYVHVGVSCKYSCTADHGRKLIAVLEGAVDHEGTRYDTWSGFNLGADESVALTSADGPAVLLVLQLPHFLE